MFKCGDRVDIIEGSYAGFDGIVLSVEPNYFYKVYINDKTNPITSYEIISEDFLQIRENQTAQLELTSFDITKYLSEDQMKDIATRVYEEQITKFVDDVLERRTPPYGGIVDQVLIATVEKYVTKLSDKFEADFLAKAKQVIESTDPGNDDHTSFQEQLTFKLSSVADKCIEANMDVIYGHMSKAIETAANNVGINELAKKISRKIDVNQIIVDLLHESLNVNTEK